MSGYDHIRARAESDVRFTNNVVYEIAAARAKFPGSYLVLAALVEEVGELAQAMLKHKAGKLPASEVWKEAVQVAAMAQRVATEGDPSFDGQEYKDG